MDLVYICLGWIFLAVGLIGCFLPVLPGLPIAYLALLAALARGDHSSPSVTCLVVAGVVTAVVMVLDFVVPALGAKKFNCNQLTILTFDEQETITEGDFTIHVLPASQWLLK